MTCRDYSIGSDHWNGLSKIIEEVAELQVELNRLQIFLGKLIGSNGDPNHWSGDLRKALMEEIPDVQAAIRFFINKNFCASEQFMIYDRFIEKVRRFETWDKENASKNQG